MGVPEEGEPGALFGLEVRQPLVIGAPGVGVVLGAGLYVLAVADGFAVEGEVAGGPGSSSWSVPSLNYAPAQQFLIHPAGIPAATDSQQVPTRLPHRAESLVTGG